MGGKIITISREFGSGGREIGKQVAARLGVPFCDKEIIAKVAEETGLAKEYIEQSGEYSPIKSMFAYAFVSRDASGISLMDQLYAVQRKIIMDTADKGSCVIVGRCADYILRDRTDCLHVFIYGNEKEKCERIMKLYHKTEDEAKRLMREMDKKRSVNYNYYTEQKWGNYSNYSIALNSSELGYDTCVDIIMDLTR